MKGDTVRRSPLLVARSGILAWGCDSRPRVSATPTVRRASACPDTRRFLATAVIFVTAALAACGGSSDTGSTSQPTVDAVAAKLRAGGIACHATIAPPDEREFIARDQGDCDVDGHILRIVIYNTNSSRDQAVKIGREFGGIGVIGDRWVVEVPDDATAERVQRALGGKVI